LGLLLATAPSLPPTGPPQLGSGPPPLITARSAERWFGRGAPVWLRDAGLAAGAPGWLRGAALAAGAGLAAWRWSGRRAPDWPLGTGLARHRAGTPPAPGRRTGRRAFTWKLCIARKFRTRERCFISIGCRVSALCGPSPC